MKHLKSSSGINAEYGRCMSTKSELLGAVWSAPFVVQPKLFTDTLSLVIKAIKLEMKLYQKILYNHNNSHKKTKYWQKLRQVKGRHFLPVLFISTRMGINCKYCTEPLPPNCRDSGWYNKSFQLR
eukprot:TRINITY_DN2692_c0_g1_i3.p1 TRINITY_DN2692_c0_g1~~TRINITY_DN2692_c0_g1_i3.p1  ORF type:complete len:135 (-),score=23.81 TRINITY_DN2692_c0_g1_i3:798-1172(-)